MGKTKKPLVILIHPDLQDWEEFSVLREQGHRVEVGVELGQPDLVLAPNAHWMGECIRKYLDMAIKATQGRKYLPKTPGGANV